MARWVSPARKTAAITQVFPNRDQQGAALGHATTRRHCRARFAIANRPKPESRGSAPAGAMRHPGARCQPGLAPVGSPKEEARSPPRWCCRLAARLPHPRSPWNPALAPTV